jgi:hypothetical protein
MTLFPDCIITAFCFTRGQEGLPLPLSLVYLLLESIQVYDWYQRLEESVEEEEVCN